MKPAQLIYRIEVDQRHVDLLVKAMTVRAWPAVPDRTFVDGACPLH